MVGSKTSERSRDMPHFTVAPSDAHTPARATMTVDESKALTKGARVYLSC